MTKEQPVPRRIPTTLLLSVAACLAVLASLPAVSSARPFETAIFDPAAYEADDGPVALARTRAAGATSVRIWVGWKGVAPDGATKPEGFDARDPADPNYLWTYIDQYVNEAKSQGLEPILLIVDAPEWAQRDGGGSSPGHPAPKELGYFAEAIARHYSGTVPGVPRVSRWELWNEPNLYRYVLPQYDTPFDQDVPPGAKALSPGFYREMLRVFAAAVHRVHRDNLVVVGGLAPFGRAEDRRHAVPPLEFMRELLCIKPNNKPRDGCKPVHFDVWSHHPYTEGGPNHKAAVEGNASMGDLPAMRRILDAAIRADHIVSRSAVKFWVTEFSWDTNPPDDVGVPARVHARWMAEAFYRMWRQGVSLVTWFKVKDETQASYLGVRHQSGLYTACAWHCAKPKLSFRAFRFPFVAFRTARRVRVWGRTPTSTPDEVAIEQRGRNGWHRLGKLRADGDGIFKKRFRAHGHGPVRARVSGSPTASTKGRERSVPFELKDTPDMSVSVFGS
jgi:hypothetical protein